MSLYRSELLNIENKAKQRRWWNRARVVFEHGRNLAVHLAPEVEDRLSLLPGDIVEQKIEGNRVILTFSRKEAAEHSIPQDVLLEQFGATALWQAEHLHETERHEGSAQ